MFPESFVRPGQLFFEKTSKTHLQLFRYIIVGAICALFDTGIFMIFTTLLDAHYLVAQTLGFLVGISLNYFLSITFVFQSKRKRLPETTLFLLTGIIGLLISYFFLWLLIDILALTAFENLIAKLLTIIIVLGWNFTSRKVLIF